MNPARPRHRPTGLLKALILASALVPAATPAAGSIDVRRVVIDDDFPDGYQVEVADVNGDGRPDLIGVGGSTCAWYENPSWRKRLISGPGRTDAIISSATADLDGDGRAEVAIAYDFAMNTPTRGKILLAVPGPTADAPWSLRPAADLPSVHRLRWADLDGDGKPELIAAPLFGASARPPAYDQEPARPRAFSPGLDPLSGRWAERPGLLKGEAPVLHAVAVTDLDGDGRPDLLGASNLGLTRFTGPGAPARLAAGAAGPAPRRGSSEVHAGRLRDGRRFLAAVEPWHGAEVVVYPPPAPGATGFGPRTVIDATLNDGHALWVADLDGDGDDEVIAGHRGKDHRVSAYRFDGRQWSRTVLDRAVAAQDLRGGDLDGDGAPDVVAVGGSTHNLVWYKFLAGRRADDAVK